MNQTSKNMYDFVVIGSGPGGTRAAVQASKLGMSVALIEAHSGMGGFCVHTGTLPSKSLRESVYRYALSSKGKFGGKKKGRAEVPDLIRLIERRDRVIEKESEVFREQLIRNKVDIIRGFAQFLTSDTVEVSIASGGSTKISSRIFVIATGAHPVSPRSFTVDGKFILDSNSVLGLQKLPKQIAVLGAGIIGCEYASIFATAGTKVILIDKRNEILADVDREIVNRLVEIFEDLGMELVLGAETQAVEILEGQDSVRLKLSNQNEFIVDRLLFTQGRQGNTKSLGLEKIGIRVNDRGLIPVNSCFQTCVPTVYAVGDVIGFPALASTSMEQGRKAALHAIKNETCGLPAVYPYGIYTIPEVSTIGKTEEELKAAGVDYVVGRSRFRETARGQIVGDEFGLLKIIFDRKKRTVLGTHIVGDSAAELIHIAQAVMVFGGTLDYFVENVFNYPTFAEAYKSAAMNALNQMMGLPHRKFY